MNPIQPVKVHFGQFGGDAQEKLRARLENVPSRPDPKLSKLVKKGNKAFLKDYAPFSSYLNTTEAAAVCNQFSKTQPHYTELLQVIKQDSKERLEQLALLLIDSPWAMPESVGNWLLDRLK